MQEERRGIQFPRACVSSEVPDLRFAVRVDGNADAVRVSNDSVDWLLGLEGIDDETRLGVPSAQNPVAYARHDPAQAGQTDSVRCKSAPPVEPPLNEEVIRVPHGDVRVVDQRGDTSPVRMHGYLIHAIQLGGIQEGQRVDEG